MIFMHENSGMCRQRKTAMAAMAARIGRARAMGVSSKIPQAPRTPPPAAAGRSTPLPPVYVALTTLRTLLINHLY